MSPVAPSPCAAGRCSVFPDLNVITFDGNSVAVYKAAAYIVTRLPNETVSVLVQECPVDSESPVRTRGLLDILNTHSCVNSLTCSVSNMSSCG